MEIFHDSNVDKCIWHGNRETRFNFHSYNDERKHSGNHVTILSQSNNAHMSFSGNRCEAQDLWRYFPVHHNK